MKSIRGRILFNMVGGMALLALILGVASSWFCMQSAVRSAEKILSETAQIAAKEIENGLRMYENIAFEVGCLPQLASPALTLEEKQAILEQRVISHGFSQGNLLGLDGISVLDGLDLSDRDYFQNSVQGKTWISDPLVSKSTGELVLTVSAPVWKDGNPNSQEVVGVVYFTSKELLSHLLENIKVGQVGESFLLNKNGSAIAHSNATLQQQDISKPDKGLEKLAALEARMIQGQSGFGEYRQNGMNRYLAFAPVAVPGAWSIGVSIGKSELLAYTNRSVVMILGLSLGLLAFFTLISIRIAARIARPITRVTKRIELVAKGDLHSPVEIERSRDETQTLSLSAKQTVDQLNTYIDAIGMALHAIAEGNLTIEKPPISFEGDFIQLETFVNDIIAKLTKTMTDMQRNAEQVAYSSGQVSDAAQSLSAGTTEQSSAIETLTATLHETSKQIQHSARNAKTAMEQTDLTGQQLAESSEKMNQMVSAMHAINHKADEISKIIKTIEDIAFQTNILALNAAVEAARAGVSGKGFAVVADEVRNLAGKSAEAAQSTTTLIAETVRAVKSGTAIADDMAHSLAGVVDGSNLVTEAIHAIAKTSALQADGITQVSQNVNQISGVVQQNSATAEESAASSEELNAQAQALKNLVAEFRLKPSDPH